MARSRPAGVRPASITSAQQPASLALPHAKRQAIQQLLLAWYRRERRDLPWRHTHDPYAILVSEIMLQQTQVDRVLPKYHQFLSRYPTLAALAAAPRAQVIRDWSPLGYNLRAVRLHEIARQAVEQHAGRLPDTMEGLLSLKGIGRYTAAAVACFAFGQEEPLLDTNVRRVLGRLYAAELPGAAEDDRLSWRLAEQALPRTPPGATTEDLIWHAHPLPGEHALLPASQAHLAAPGEHALLPASQAHPDAPGEHALQPVSEAHVDADADFAASAAGDPLTSAPTTGDAYDWNQALMDLGATICISRSPRCLLCPVQEWCSARAEWVTATDQAEVRQADDALCPPLLLVAEQPAAYNAASTARTGRRSGPAERFEGSRRWYRGRIVDALRALPLGGTLDLASLGAQVKPDYSTSDEPWLTELTRALARDGLATLTEGPDGALRLTLPDERTP